MSIPVDPNAEALIFDLDGTLLDTLSVHHQAWRETLGAFELDMTAKFFQRIVGMTSHAIVDIINEENGLSLDPDRIAMAKDQAYVRHAPLIQPFPVVLDIVQSYQGSHKLGAATNENFGIANIVMRTTGLSPLFHVLVTADDVDQPKPAPDIFLTCAQRLGVSPDRCHVFEDSPFGIEAACSAGMVVTDVRPYL